jgi:Holliday junction resolvase RusA-like endonuclease
MNQITIELAGPPRGKGRGRAVSTKFGARVFTDNKTRLYEAQLRYVGEEVMAGRAPIAIALRVDVVARFPIAQSWSKRKRADALAGSLRPCTTPDADNILKILDGLNNIVWVDDKQIVDATVRKIYSDRPGLTITVRPITGSLFPAEEHAPHVERAAGPLFAA